MKTDLNLGSYRTNNINTFSNSPKGLFAVLCALFLVLPFMHNQLVMLFKVWLFRHLLIGNRSFTYPISMAFHNTKKSGITT